MMSPLVLHQLGILIWCFSEKQDHSVSRYFWFLMFYKVRPDSDLHKEDVKIRCDYYLLGQLKGQLFRERWLYLHYKPDALTIGTSPDVLNIEPFIRK